MKKDKNNSAPSGFDDILGQIYSNSEYTDEVTDIDSISQPNTPLVEDEDKTEPPVTKPEDGDKTDDTIDNNAKDDDSNIPEDVLNNTDNTKSTEEDSTDDVNVQQADIDEAQQIGLLFDAVGESLGWNMADIADDEKPVTVDELTNYLAETVKQNSIPTYADERVQALDEYIKNGGRFEDFYSIQKQGLDLESVDLEDDANQKSIIKELMKYDGYNDEQINKRIRRYEDADMLYEESEDALERLKAIKKSETEAITRRQEETARIQAEQSKRFFDDVTHDINNLTSIRGISIPKEDRKALFDYIFKVDGNGVSLYQKDFNQNLVKNLIESAYFTMKADALISNAKKDGETSAAEKLRKMLRHSTKNHSTYNIDEKQKSVIDLASGLF